MIQLSSEVVLMLNMMGLPYPDIDADQVRELAQYVREFIADVRETHESATGAINAMGSVYSGRSYEALIARWAMISEKHIAQLDAAAGAVASGLDVTADLIEIVQAAVLVELVALAAAFLGMLMTPGAGVISPLMTAVVRRILRSMQEVIIGYVVAEVIVKALEPFEEKIEQFINGAMYDSVSDFLDVPPGNQLYIEPDEVRRYARELDSHADRMVEHGEKFAAKAERLTFAGGGYGLPENERPGDPAVFGTAPLPGYPIPPMSPSPPAQLPAEQSTGAAPGGTADQDGQEASGSRSAADPSGAAGQFSGGPQSGPAAAPGQAASPTAMGTPVRGHELAQPGSGPPGAEPVSSDSGETVRRAAEPAPDQERVIRTSGVGEVAATPMIQAAPMPATEPATGSQSAARPQPAAAAGSTATGKGSAGAVPSRSGAGRKPELGRPSGRTPWSRTRPERPRAVPGGPTQQPPAVSAETADHRQPATGESASPPVVATERSRVFVPETTPPPSVPTGKTDEPEKEEKVAEANRDGDLVREHPTKPAGTGR